VVLVPAIALTALLDHIGLAFFADSSVYAGDPAYHQTVPAEHLARRLTPLVALGNALFVQTNLVPTFGTNASLWSLAYEASFYAVLPLVLCAWRSPRLPARLANLAVLVLVCAVAGFDVLLYLPVWLLGAAVAAFRQRIGGWLRRWSPRPLAAARGTAAAAVLAAMCLTQRGYSHLNVAMLAITTTVLVALLVDDLSWSGLPGRTLDALSRYAHCSYALYAIHLPIAALVTAVLVPDAAHRWSPTPLTWGALGGILTGLLVVAWVFGWLTERRTARLRAVLERVPGFRTGRS
jgi:peptidoglycan/LPS O-acetylase OafA/YrhL